MVTLEVNKMMITWPDDFAILMMKYYRDHGVSFIVHRNCIHTAGHAEDKKTSLAKPVGTASTQVIYMCCGLREKL
jgi:hypothetical protein